ncbi:MAG: hypothetical protein U0704_07180 [Candidatus Eisenbacteria bacterium]
MSRRSRVLRAGVSTLLVALAAGCASRSHAPRVEGAVQLEEYVTDPDGVTTDSLLLATATGVPVWLAADSLHYTFAGTRRGFFSVEAPAGDYLLLAGPTLWTADTLGPVHLAQGTMSLDTAIVLGNAGRVRVRANMTGQPARVIRCDLAGSARVLLAIRALDGRVARVLADRSFAAGSYELTWDGTDGVGVPLAPGTYWVTLEKFPPGTTRTAPAGPLDIPVGGGGPFPGSPRRGERALLHWP